MFIHQVCCKAWWGSRNSCPTIQTKHNFNKNKRIAYKWMKMVPPIDKAFFMNTAASIKCWPRFSQGTSLTYNTLYLNDFGKGGAIPPKAWRICVIPNSFRITKLLAAFIPPRYIPSNILFNDADIIINKVLWIILYNNNYILFQ